MHDELVFDLAQVKLEVVSHELLPSVLEVEEDVLANVLLRRL